MEGCGFDVAAGGQGAGEDAVVGAKSSGGCWARCVGEGVERLHCLGDVADLLQQFRFREEGHLIEKMAS
jgi:hypothetical protein